jgi:hypothetical protein
MKNNHDPEANNITSDLYPYINGNLVFESMNNLNQKAEHARVIVIDCIPLVIKKEVAFELEISNPKVGKPIDLRTIFGN